MIDATSQKDALEALKALNTAITTTRLYPADAPQVPASVIFSIENDEYMLCGVPIQKQTLGKLHGADIFQHLKLLELRYTVIKSGIDRKTFKQILTFFITSPQKIRKGGGGMVYAVQLGLGDVFPVSPGRCDETGRSNPERPFNFSQTGSDVLFGLRFG